MSATSIVDPILTKVIQGYGVPNNVGHELFPDVDVQTTAGKVTKFTSRDFKAYNSKRAAGSNTKRVTYGYSSESYVLDNHGLEGVLAREDLRDARVTAPTVKLEKQIIRLPWNSMALELEIEQANLACDLNNYADSNKKILSGTSQWTSADSDPEADIKAAKKAIRRQCGVNPNKLVLSPSAFDALTTHKKILARLGTTAHGEAITEEMLAKLFKLKKVVVGEAVVFDDELEDTKDVWNNDAVLAYVPAQNELDKAMPSFGYTYNMTGHPFVESKYYDNNTKSFIYPVTHEREPMIAGITAGYLFKNVAGA